MSKLYEEVNPFQFTGKGKMDVADASVRDNINTLLTGALMSCTLTPYIALEKVRKVLAYYHISIPGTSFMEGDRGIKTFEVEQFGLKFGMKNDGSVVNYNSVDKDMTHGASRDGESFNSNTPPATKVTDEKFHIYFEYKMNDKGLFDVFSEIVTDDELEDLLDDAEEDINADKSEDDRNDRLNEAKIKASKIISEIKLVGEPGAPTDSQAQYLSRMLRNPTQTDAPAGFIKSVGAPERIPSTSDLKKVADQSTAQSGMNTPGSATDPQAVIARLNSLPDTKPPAPSEHYLSKVTETSHESVNHVRRLAMKNKRNDR